MQQVIHSPPDPSDATSVPQGTPPQPKITPRSSGGKEQEAAPSTKQETIQAISSEVILPEEVEKVGVTVTEKPVIELPPDVARFGVTPIGSSIPVTQSSDPGVVLPISDQKIMAGLHMTLTSAFHWLAIWCIKKLHKAHMIIKVIHGKIIRVKVD